MFPCAIKIKYVLEVVQTAGKKKGSPYAVGEVSSLVKFKCDVTLERLEMFP